MKRNPTPRFNSNQTPAYFVFLVIALAIVAILLTLAIQFGIDFFGR